MIGRLARVAVFGCFVIAAYVPDASAQASIPVLLAEAGKSLTRHTTIPSGPPVSLTDLVRETDTIVRGVVGEPRSYLSPDERYVYTDYPIEKPVFLLTDQAIESRQPGAIQLPVVTMTSGSVTINGLTFTEMPAALPELTPGMECVFLLRRTADKYRIVGDWYGAFDISGGRIVPLTRKQRFAAELTRMSAGEAIRYVLSLKGKP